MRAEAAVCAGGGLQGCLEKRYRGGRWQAHTQAWGRKSVREGEAFYSGYRARARDSDCMRTGPFCILVIMIVAPRDKTQVLLMTKEEFNELKREHGGEQAAAGGSAAGKKGAAGKSPIKGAAGKGKKGKGGAAAAKEEAEVDKAGEGKEAAALPKLSLGTALLEEDEDFAEMVCIATLQVSGRVGGDGQRGTAPT